MHIVELPLITPFTNAEVERLFGKMNSVKTMLQNRLDSQRLETQLRIGGGSRPLNMTCAIAHTRARTHKFVNVCDESHTWMSII